MSLVACPPFSLRSRFRNRRSVRLIAVAALIAGWQVIPAAAQSGANNGDQSIQNALTLTGSGRTVAVASDVRAGVVRVAVLDTPERITICNDQKSALRPGPVRFRYLVLPEVTSPRELSQFEGQLVSQQTNGAFVFQGVGQGQFVLFNLFREPSPDRESEIVAACWKSIADAKGLQERREEDVKVAEQLVKDGEALVATLRQRIESQRADAAAFGGRAEAAARIAEVLHRVGETRVALTTAETELVDQRASLAAAQEALANTPDEIRSNLGMSLSDAEYTVTMLRAGSLMKVGGILLPPSRAIYYDFAHYSAPSSLQLMPIGAYPIVRYHERQFAVIANVVSSQHRYGFYLIATAQDGAVVNTDPVRPTFADPQAEAALATTLPTRRATSRAYVDVILPIRGAFAPNQYPEVTIATERPANDDPTKRETVTLVDKAKYPQFRAMYRYNFNTGVFGSALRGAQFTKVRTRDDDPTTETSDESLFRIQETQSEGPVKPIFAFTYYLKPVDIQAPVSHERWIPNPTIGFAFANPADNIYFGFSHELLRNAQVYWGWHWGVAKELVARNDVSEDRDASNPPTRDTRARAFGVGLTFNVAVITKIFK